MKTVFEKPYLFKKNKYLVDDQSSVYIKSEEIMRAIKCRITRAALNRGLSFKAPKKLALISGAGIAGLAASFELVARGFTVVIAERRTVFDRFNVINLDVDSKRFLTKFGLLDEFEKTVAGKISKHQYMLADKTGLKALGSSDVRELQPSDIAFEPDDFDKLFTHDGFYSVRIRDLQTFLAQKALEAGVHLFGNVEIEMLDRTITGEVSAVQLAGKNSLSDPMKLQPHFLFLAEGTHSTTAKRLGFNTHAVQNECSNEKWIFGNIPYYGEETFVVSLIDISGKSLEIANIIFNANIQEINIAVTSNEELNQECIKKRVLEIARQVLHFQQREEILQPLIQTVKHPVHVSNEQRAIYSRGNVFCIGDTAGHSSPLAGIGGTLGLTLVPGTVKKLLQDALQQPEQMHNNFHRYTDAYTNRWISKALGVKKHCLGFFNRTECRSSNLDHTEAEANKSGLICK